MNAHSVGLAREINSKYADRSAQLRGGSYVVSQRIRNGKWTRYTLKEALLEQSLIWHRGKLQVTGSDELANSVVRIVKAMAAIVRTEEPLFSVTQERGRLRFSETALGKEFRWCLSLRGTQAIRGQFPNHRFNPMFELFERVHRGLTAEAGRPTVCDVDLFNNRVRLIRNKANEEGLTRAIRNNRRTMLKNRRALLGDLKVLRRRHRRMIAIRMDVGYTSEFVQAHFHGKDIPYEVVARHRAQFIRYLKRGGFKKSLLWYAWKQEGAFQKGPHTHYLILFDGRRLRKDGAVAHLLGRHWVEVIAPGFGTAFNCNSNKKRRYRRIAIGQLRREDDETWSALNEVVVSYMTKTDEYFRFETPGRARSFGRSALLKSAAWRGTSR